MNTTSLTTKMRALTILAHALGLDVRDLGDKTLGTHRVAGGDHLFTFGGHTHTVDLVTSTVEDK